MEARCIRASTRPSREAGLDTNHEERRVYATVEEIIGAMIAWKPVAFQATVPSDDVAAIYQAAAEAGCRKVGITQHLVGESELVVEW